MRSVFFLSARARKAAARSLSFVVGTAIGLAAIAWICWPRSR